MIQIDISEDSFKCITQIYSQQIQKKLELSRCYFPLLPEFIYDILANCGAENILRYSLRDMEQLLARLRQWSLWSTFSSPGCGNKKKDGTPYVDCGKCTLHESCIQYNILKDLQKIFDYDGWCCDTKTFFKPYDFIKSLNIKACPYCNLEYIQTATFKRSNATNEEDKYVRPSLDHFYPKSKYPFFSLSLNNLVPSCTICNSSIKHDDDSLKSYKDIIHPYDKKFDYHNCIRYAYLDIPKDAINKFLKEYGEKLKDDISELGISLQEGAKNILIAGIPWNEENDEYHRAKRMFDYFAIKPRLEQGHNDYIREIAIKAIEYSEDYIIYLKDKGYSLSESLRLLFGNYVEPKDFNQRPLSKITHDIIEQLRPDILEELEKENTQETL